MSSSGVTTRSFKLLTIGETDVGKTSIINKYVNDIFGNCTPTVGIVYSSKLVTFQNDVINLNLYDTSGQERYHSLAFQNFRGVDIFLIIFDLSKRNSFEAIPSWYNDIMKNNSKKTMVICIVGNKADLKDDVIINDSEVQQVIKKLKNKYEIRYYKTSAKTGEGIETMFKELVEQRVNLGEEETTEVENLFLSQRSTKKRGHCC